MAPGNHVSRKSRSLPLSCEAGEGWPKAGVGALQNRIVPQMAQMMPEGDCAVRVQFGEAIDEGVNAKVHAFCRAVEKAAIPGVVEWVPAYCVATVYYSPGATSFEQLRDSLAALAAVDEIPSAVSVIEVPVVYGGDFGPDLADLANRAGLSEEEAIALHSHATYRCYMVGFMPGFPYLGEVPAPIRTPRLATPRVRVPAGSVAIAEAQTGIYPRESPGGWNLIGRTPLSLFNPDCNPPALIAPGDFVRFFPVDLDEYESLLEAERLRLQSPLSPLRESGCPRGGRWG